MLCTSALENPARAGMQQRYLDAGGAGDYLGFFVLGYSLFMLQV